MQSTNMIIEARKLLNYSTEQLWDILTGEFTLVFDDGEKMETTANRTLYSSYCWDIHRHFTKLPLLAKHHAQSISAIDITVKTHCDLMNRAIRDIIDGPYYPLFNSYHELRDVLSNIAFEATNALNNAIVDKMPEFQLGMDFDAMMEVLLHPEVFEANNAMREEYSQYEAINTPAELLEITDGIIQRTYKKIETTIRKNSDLQDNVVSKLLRCGIPNTKQLLQGFSSRGYMTRTDSTIIKKPVLYGYLEGIRDFTDSFIEAQSGAKAYIYQTAPLEQVQYFARRLRLASQAVMRLHEGDCGSTRYWLFDGVSKRDLTRLSGAYYLDEETGRLGIVRENSEHLIGKNIRLRTPNKCNHPDPQGICTTCFGRNHFAVTRGVNLGNMCSTSFTKFVAQLVLSTKHYDGTSTVRPIVLNANSERFFSVRKDRSTYYLNPKLKQSYKHIELVIDKTMATNINNIYYVDDPGCLNIQNTSELSMVRFVIKGDQNDVSEHDLDVYVDSRLSSMSHALLKYIKEKNYYLDQKDNYVINLDDWDVNEPLFILPMKHFDMRDYQKSIEEFIESTLGAIKARDSATNIDGLLRSFYELVNSQLETNISLIATIFYASNVISSSEGRFELPKQGDRAVMGVAAATFTGRSIASWTSYEGHVVMFNTPTCYAYKNRLDHPADAMIVPEILNKNYSYTL